MEVQLRKTLEEHLRDIKEVIDYVRQFDMDINVYLEDWSNGMKDSPDSVFASLLMP